jgi:hypothetical protein
MSSIFENHSKPLVKYLEFKPKEGVFVWYDKETRQNVQYEAPVNFLPLFEMATLGGFKKATQEGYWSNEMPPRDTKTKPFTLRLGRNIVAVETWANIKALVPDAKYCLAIYGVVFGKGKDNALTSELCCIKLIKSTLTAWINARVRLGEARLITLEKGEFLTEEYSEARKKMIPREIQYHEVSIKKGEKHPALVEAAMPYAVSLKEYFEQYEAQEATYAEVAQEALPPAPVEASPMRTAPAAPIEAAPVWLDNTPEDDLPF